MLNSPSISNYISFCAGRVTTIVNAWFSVTSIVMSPNGIMYGTDRMRNIVLRVAHYGKHYLVCLFALKCPSHSMQITPDRRL